MIRIHLPMFDLDIFCESFDAHSSPPSRNGYIAIPSDIHITAVFKDRPEIMRRIGIGGMIVEEMMVYLIPDEPPITFHYVVVDKEEYLHRNAWCIHMKALRSSIERRERPDKNRVCKCGTRIEYWFVASLMNESGMSFQIINDIWNNDLFQFKCCTCFRIGSNYVSLGGGEILTSWIESPPEDRIRGSRAPPE